MEDGIKEKKKKTPRKSNTYSMAEGIVRDGEVRCPSCGKLLLRGGFSKGTYLDLRCRDSKCKYHKESLRLLFE